MSQFGLLEKDLSTIAQAIAKFPEIKSVKIFGSRALGNYKKASDIDMVLFGQISIETISKLKWKLEEETTLPYFFDILSYQTIETKALKDHIDQHGVLIFSLA